MFQVETLINVLHIAIRARAIDEYVDQQRVAVLQALPRLGMIKVPSKREHRSINELVDQRREAFTCACHVHGRFTSLPFEVV